MKSQRRYLFLPLILFFFVSGIGGVFIIQAEREHSAERHCAIREVGAGQAHLLKNHLDQVLSVVHAFASVLADKGTIERFDRLAAKAIKDYQSISTLQLAPNGVIMQAYPPAPNDAAIGHDLLNDPRHRAEALLAIESRALTFAGPIALPDGGTAVTGLLPVFLQDDAGGGRFWGFTVVVINLQNLFKAINLQRLVEQELHYALWRGHPDAGTRVVLTRFAEADPPPYAIPFAIEVPNETWTLAVWLRGGPQFRYGLWVEIVLVLFASGLSALIAYRLARRSVRRLAANNRALQAQIVRRKEVEETLRNLHGRLVNAGEETHRLLARELHDGLAQRVAVLGVEAGKLHQDSGKCPDFVRERVKRMNEQIVRLAEDIHRISRQLHPSILDHLGLADAIESECASSSDVVSVKFTAARLPASLPNDVSLCLYRVAQASLTNIVKHSRAKKAFVRLAGDDGSVSLSIQDDGIGFDPACVQEARGLGLVSMRERVRLLKGSFLLKSEPGQGTLIEVRVPLAGREG